MELSVTVTQAITIKNALSAQALLLYARNGSDLTKVGGIALLDAKAGQIFLRWATEGDAPTVTALLTQVPNAIEVADITG